MTTAKRPTDADGQPEHRYMRFNPEITTGNILQVASLLIALAIGYGAYREDQTRQDSKISQVELLSERDRTETGKALVEVKARLDKQGDQLQDIKESLAILRGRAAETTGVKR